MLDGHRSGRSTGRVSCKSTELKRCSMMEKVRSLSRISCVNTNSAPDFGNKVQSCGTEDAKNDCFLSRGSGGGPADEDHMDRYWSRNVSVGQGHNDRMSSCRGRML